MDKEQQLDNSNSNTVVVVGRHHHSRLRRCLRRHRFRRCLRRRVPACLPVQVNLIKNNFPSQLLFLFRM